jgi:glycine cleavage system H lipoate-binding protein/ABC-type phosphate transport system substrate-binding protein
MESEFKNRDEMKIYQICNLKRNNPMKKFFASLIVLVLMGLSTMNGKAIASDTLRITSTPDIYALASSWADEYSSLTPGLNVKVIKASDNIQAEELIGRGMLGFVTARNYSRTGNKSEWHTIVGRDVIVPVININNPALEEIRRLGISSEELIKLINSNGLSWSSVIPSSKNIPVNYYWSNEETVSASLLSFFGTTEINKTGIELENSDAIAEAVRKDPSGIGFCRLTSVADMRNQVLNEGIALLPIDRNNNGLLDETENVYGDLKQLIRGIWIGKYPKALTTSIYAAGINPPEGKTSVAFMKWILTDGQKFLYDKGYNDLLLTERQRSLENLYEAKVYTAVADKTRSPFVVLLILFAGSVALVFLTDRVIRFARKSRAENAVPVAQSGKAFGESAVIVPNGIYFDKTHTWAFMEQDGMVKVGIDDFLQHITGTITRVNMKKDGTKVQKGEQILSLVQNGKHLDLYAPVSGIIREHNVVLETNSGLINNSPYREGWIYRIEPSNWHRENQLLFYADKYRQYLSQEFTRLKDFMSAVLTSGNKDYSHVVLQDGGEISDGILSLMGPEVWDDFQTKYIDPSRQIWFYEMF